ncbi:MAG: Cof-type HAD-IIB family hydrolase [Muribaculaceae bacterium]|nr:Cof-type HAD-IIB family hydrolase [Muribaculaceae bacterium]
MIKAIFFDVDGTLVSFRQKFLSDQLVKDLPALQDKGIKLFLSTGRAMQDLESTGMLRGVKMDGYVTLNGQYCCDRDGTVYRDVPIDLADLQGAYRVLMENPQLPALLEGNGESYLSQINDRVLEVFEFLHTELYPVIDPKWLLEGKVYQFVPLVKPEEEDVFLAAMPGCKHTRWHSEGVDIIPRGGGKAVGVQATMERYGWTAGEVMAFGDGENDGAMLELVGVGVAMGNASDEVKTLADYITADVDEDGVSQALRHFGLL